MAQPPRLDRKSLRTPDAFVSRGSTLLGFLVERRSLFLILLSVVAGSVVLFYGYGYWTGRRLEAGWNQFHKAEKAQESKRIAEFKKVYADNGSLRPGFLAAVKVADHLFDEAKKLYFKDKSAAKPFATDAAEWYAKARNFSDLLPTEKQLLGVNQGDALEMADQLDSAITEFRIASELPGEARGLALLHLAQAYESKGDVNQAVINYEKVTTDFGGTEYAKIAKNSIRRFKSPLFSKP